ncbi:NAD(P)-dependent alcohol dehydrogenase [Sphingomonas sp. SUN019]|uniref:NAD(P)-dependent alcohol dehydrogenase n=1 Tax=Sphingomonas sp. SUN019 TaxID=2937788 RepID=UPI00216419FB|nr:NAD(P)-dependent alcohol dehydrogenase [Sphingomonas sp. SUN019]UVO51037.1 NAD(P)-dependent alcohol dehydrogenase [Sphingomonas sp. SUN019]
MTNTIAAVARQPGAPFAIETLSVDEPRDGEVLVRIAGVGLCHTDLIFRDQFAPYPLPAVLGHEGSGTIAAIGGGVSGLAVGDRVVLGFSSCGACARCDEGLPSYCAQFPPLNYAGMRLDDGSTALSNGDEAVASHFFGQSSFAGHAIVRARNVVKVDDAAAALELLGPLGCGFQTGAGGVMRSMACPAGSSIVVLGGGPVGLAAVMGAAIQRCARIILVEPVAARRDLAIELGATDTIDPADGDVTAAIRAILPGGVDFAFDTSGRVAVIEAALAALAPRGLIGLVGVPATADATLTVNIAAAITFGQRIIGIMEGDSDPQVFIPELIAHHRAGRFPFDRLIRTYPLAEINEAIAAQARGECVKVVLIP